MIFNFFKKILLFALLVIFFIGLAKVYRILKQPPVIPISPEQTITIIEGWRLEEIAKYLEEQGLVFQKDFLALAINPAPLMAAYPFLAERTGGASLEGYLFPDTYRVFKSTSAQEVIGKMLDNFDKKLTPELREKIKASKRSIFEAVILASIVEKEVRTPEDMKMVADVFIKRLKSGIALRSDATVNYITGKGLVQPTLTDTKIDNLYNTYLYQGLPPGPIANPGFNALAAVIEPTANPYYYFLTTSSGQVIYSKTYEEHLQNKRKYLD